MLRHFKILFLIVTLTLVAPVVEISHAQDDPGVTGVDTSPGTPVTFDDPDDYSLFVGHYRLNPGDTVYIEVVTDITQYYIPLIDEEGYITIPVIGRVLIAELTSTEAREKIQELADEYYRSAWITLRVTKIAKVKFYVYGDIDLPGFYTAPGTTTFFDFLQKFELAGEAAHRRIVHVKGDINAALPEPLDIIGGDRETSSELIQRSLELYKSGNFEEINPLVTILDPLDFTIEGEIEQKNFYLEYGDVIYIPDPEISINLDGFRRPGPYEVLPGETWADIIRLAGEPTHLRDIANIILERRDSEGTLSQLFYNLNLLEDAELARIEIEHRDHLTAVNYEVNVYVLGEVNLAGAYTYSPVSNPLDYIALAGGATGDAHLKFARIVRPPRDPNAPLDESDVYVINLMDMINDGAPMSSIGMEPGDILFIPDKGEEITMGAVLSGLSVLVNTIRLFE